MHCDLKLDFMKTSQILQFMKVVSWVIFIGTCIRAGAMLISFIISAVNNNDASNNLYLGLDLSEVLDYSFSTYLIFVVTAILLTMVKAYIFFWVIKLFSKFDEANPFSASVSVVITKISYYALVAGVFALVGTGLSKWLAKQGVVAPFEWSAREFLFMAGVVFVIGLFYKRGIEIQAENELTI